MKANLNSLKQIFKILFLLGIFSSVFSNTQAASNKFCLEEDGFIMPMIEQKCNNIISITEFKHLITLKQNLRVKELINFRKLAKKPTKIEKEKVTVAEAKKITNEIIKKIILNKSVWKNLLY